MRKSATARLSIKGQSFKYMLNIHGGDQTQVSNLNRKAAVDGLLKIVAFHAAQFLDDSPEEVYSVLKKLPDVQELWEGETNVWKGKNGDYRISVDQIN